MKKKLLVLLIAVIPTLIPNMASAIAIEIDEETNRCNDYGTTVGALGVPPIDEVAGAGVLYDYCWCDGCTP